MNKVVRKSPRTLLNAAFALSFIFAAQAFPDVQRVTEYDYDTAGNIVGIRTVQNVGPPQVNSLQPAYIHINTRVHVTATGINLNLAEVTTADSGLTISNVSATEYQVVFSIQADESAVVGPATLNFTTRLGTDPELFTVAEKTPVISTDPNPIVLKPDNQLVEVSLLFESSFETDQVYDIATTNPSIASVVEESITLLAGEREAVVHLKGLALGSTALEINQLANNLALGIPVIVTGDRLPAGVYAFYSAPLGVTVQRWEPAPGLLTTFSNPTGILRITFDQPTGSNQVLGEDLGVNLGTIPHQVSPDQVSRGASVTLSITGVELDQITAVAFSPGTGITQTAPFSVSPDGSVLQIPITIAGSAATGVRQLILTTANGNAPFSEPGGELLLITP